VLSLALLAYAATAAQPGPVSAVRPVQPAGPVTAPAAPSVDNQGELPASLRPRASSGIGRAGFLTAGELDAKCQDKSLAMVSYCYAYVTGVHDSVRAYETWLNMREFCRPLRVAQSELRQAFVEYMDKNPTAASGEAASVVVIALRQKYACDASPDRPAGTDAP
jgi:hypothetical protein